MVSLEALLGLLFGIEIGVAGFYVGEYAGLVLIAMAVVTCTAVSWLIRSISATTRRRKPSTRRSKRKS